MFVWDHVPWGGPARQVADAWITLAAIAMATDRLRLGRWSRRWPPPAGQGGQGDRDAGPAQRWPSHLGCGLGSDRFGGELSKSGEEIEDRRRGQMLDESLDIFTAAWSGRPVHHHGPHYTVDGIQFLPRPVQRPGVPVWAAGLAGNLKPLRRAARYQGFFAVNLDHPDQLARSVAALAGLRPRPAAPYDIAVGLPPGTDPEPCAQAGATWWLPEFDPATVRWTRCVACSVTDPRRREPSMPGQQDDLFDYDAELRRYHQHLRAAIDVQPADRVLDIGCGTGQTTREAARAAASGSALGIDISPARLARARRQARAEGLRNISFVQADAQAHRFIPGRFDLAISRFGTMFFADPVAAFTNIGRALRPGARLVQLAWQHRDRQEWDAVIGEVFAGEQPAPAPAADPFSLADPATASTILTAAGFTDVDVTGVHEPVYYGPDAASALRVMLSLQMTKDLLAPLDAASTGHALGQLRAALATHQSSGGVFFDSRAWLITARRP